MPLDENIAALLTVDVDWAQKTGVDKYGQDVWAAPVTLKCYPSYGHRQIEKADGTIYASQQALIFDGNDPHVQTFKLGDKFTSVGVAGGQTMEAQEISPVYSPGPSLNEAMSVWVVEVYL